MENPMTEPTKVEQLGDGFTRLTYANEKVEVKHAGGELHSVNDEPAVVYANGDKFWYKNNQLHRDGGLPAIMCEEGNQFWFKNGKLHRDGGLPAVIHPGGKQFWFKNGVRVDPVTGKPL